MKLKQEYLSYLTGETFSASLKMKMSAGFQPVRERIEYLEELTRGKKVIHVGCLDHIPLIEQRIQADTWLHKRLTDTNERCLGIDIDHEGIELVRTLGYDNIVYCNIVNDAPHPDITESQWDYMLLGEVLEHIDNPVDFLQSIALKYGNFVDRILLSVPNAFHIDNFLNSLMHNEKINTDHRYWFSPFTLAKVANSAGMKVDHYQLCQHKKNVPLRRIFYRASIWAFPMLRGSLVMELTIR